MKSVIALELVVIVTYHAWILNREKFHVLHDGMKCAGVLCCNVDTIQESGPTLEEQRESLSDSVCLLLVHSPPVYDRRCVPFGPYLLNFLSVFTLHFLHLRRKFISFFDIVLERP
ncbi:hypothetical protein L6164_007172 [Bauhinia variegata]|uniref:Uncharacterized protein n=1 Tax=Bauhinia variegata TaxID=167791 RepID=A0ACB9PWQ3_BAUVA|nr:hypothetical protein L6164_007172 [Bauhinia variegata]